ncbi:MAG TPA: hypothetical protein VHD36_12865 [Pirellulales bacterium]|nr:hypothetical protein [Pirellulales bacterium]
MPGTGRLSFALGGKRAADDSATILISGQSAAFLSNTTGANQSAQFNIIDSYAVVRGRHGRRQRSS